ncbi:MAG TPA: hypothetical protein VJU78_04205 [Chitinophagaceae bacterium]|nr:hypothetical protein [Chitinophagaceae bacterium]
MLTNNVANKNLSITNVLNELKRKEYKLKFIRVATSLYCNELRLWIMPENFNIDETYYFEETESPDSDRMLFAISLSKGVKGFLIDTCTAYMDNISPEMMQKLKLNDVISGNDSINTTAMKLLKQQHLNWRI